MSRVVGIDLSLNHAGLVCLDAGELFDYLFITDKAGHAKTDSGRGAYLPVEQMKNAFNKDKHRLLAWRVNEMVSLIWERIVRWYPVDYVAVEDYALRAEQGAHQLGEIGGLVRWMMYRASIPFRLHDPTTVKMFVAHDGTCQKDSVERAVKERWGHDFSRHNAGQKSRQTSEDLADAYGLAYMCHVEVEVRAGRMKVSDLHLKEIRVFNRITKYMPVPLVDREWIVKL
jgi:Holliday junction resolvasome RuvABC endonuclease subunit